MVLRPPTLTGNNANEPRSAGVEVYPLIEGIIIIMMMMMMMMMMTTTIIIMTTTIIITMTTTIIITMTTIIIQYYYTIIIFCVFADSVSAHVTMIRNAKEYKSLVWPIS